MVINMFVNIKNIINNEIIALNTSNIISASKVNDKEYLIITYKKDIITDLNGYQKILSLAFMDSDI
jgi:hypothetical protein